MDNRFINIGPDGVNLKQIIEYYVDNNDLYYDAEEYIEEWCALETLGDGAMLRFARGEVDFEMMEEYKNQLFSELKKHTDKQEYIKSLLSIFVDMVKRAENSSSSTTRYLSHLKCEVLADFLKRYGEL